MISRFVILGVLVFATLALHIEHEQTDFSKATYTQAVSDLSAFQKQVAANTLYSDHITDIGDFTKYLERTLTSELANLGTFQAEIIPTVSITPSTCSNLTLNQSQELIKKIECALQKTKNLTSVVSSLGSATLKVQLERRVSLQYLYLEQVKLALQNRCEAAPQVISTSLLFYNFNNSTQNWVYGANVTKNDITTLYQQISEHGTVTACPADKPYIKLGTTTCFNCQAPTPIFDLTKQECISCPGNTTLNTTTHKCQCPCDVDYLQTPEGLCIVRTVVYSNGDYLNIAGLTSDSIQKYVEEIKLAQSLPEYVAGQCAADQNSAFTLCVKCPPDQRFIVDYKRCQTCPYFDKNTMVCSFNLILNSTSTSTGTTTTTTPTTSPETGTIVTTTTVVQPVSVSPIAVAPTVVQPTTSTTTSSTVTPMSTGPTSTAPSTSSTSSTTTTTSTTTSSGADTTSFVQRPAASNVNAFDRIFAIDPSLIEVDGPQCGTATPFYTGIDANICIDCSSYFNWDTKRCESCPDGGAPIANMCL